jgi:hypothetical protein
LERLRYVLANPPVAPGCHRRVRRETARDCACRSSGVVVTLDDNTLTVTECACARWVSRDYPDGHD